MTPPTDDYDKLLVEDLPLPGVIVTQTEDPSLFKNLWTSEVARWEGRVKVDCDRRSGTREGSDGNKAVSSERSDMVAVVFDSAGVDVRTVDGIGRW